MFEGEKSGREKRKGNIIRKKIIEARDEREREERRG